jgi:hypothetical protein
VRAPVEDLIDPRPLDDREPGRALVDAISRWLVLHGLDAERFERGLIVREMMGEGGITILWNEEGPPTLELEDLVPLVLQRLGRDDPTSATIALGALWHASEKFGPISAPEHVHAHLDRVVAEAVRLARPRLHTWNAPPELLYRTGIAPRPPMPRACSWTPRLRSARTTRTRRLVRRARARSPGRKREDPHEVAARAVGLVGEVRRRR